MSDQRFFQNNTDSTKKVDFNCDAVATSTTRVITMPDRSGTLFEASSIAIDGAAITNLSALDVKSALAELQGDINTLSAIQGQYVGSSATLAGLNGITHQNGDWAILSVDDGANPRGLYVGNGTTFTLAAEIPDLILASNAEVLAGTDTAKVITPSGLSSYITALVGSATGSANLGTFTGSTIADNSSVKAALQALETAVEAAGTTTLANGTIFVGNASNVATSRTLSGDVTITNTGVATVISASDTVSGKVELATNAEVATGTDTSRATTPAGIAANYTLTTTLAGTGASQGASLIGVQDSGAFYAASTVEGVLAEIAPKLLAGTAPDWTISNAGATRTFDANAVTMQQIAQSFALLVNDLITRGVIQ